MSNTDEEVKESTSTDKEDVLEDAREYLALCKEGNEENNRAGLDDLRFLSGGVNQWDAQDAAQRSLDQRPMLTVNKLPTFLHQVTNGLRQSRSSIKVHPASDGANVDIARVRQGIIRHIEYDSNADVAYSTAACSAAAIGFGYFRIVTDYTRPDSFDQEIIFKRIRNPFTVHFDPMSESPDGSDQRKCLIESRMLRADFKRQWPKAEANDGALAIGSGDLSSNWMFEDEVVVAEFYRIEETECELGLMPDGTAVYLDDIPADVLKEVEPQIAKRRKTFKRKVMLYKLTGTDILESTEIKCYWIPVFPVYGDELDIDGKVIRSGLIRHAKDSMRMYNYWMTCATEEIALRPKTPYIGAFGQFQGFEKDWSLANRRSFPYLQYNPVTLDGNIAPAPQRQPMADIPSGMLQMAMHANDNIKATTGLFDSSLGSRGNATSGKQELAQQRQGETANFHYLDGLQITIRQAGRCVNWMIPYYMDTERVVKIMGDDDTVSSVTINQPSQQPDAIGEVLNDMTGGEYTVTVESGPPYQTLRQEAAELFSNMAHNNMELMQVAGDLIIGEMDIPGADKIAARIKKSIDPKLTQGENEGDGAGVDQKLQQISQMQQQMNQQQQQMQEHDQMLQQHEAQVKEEMLKLREEQSRMHVEKAQIDAQIRIEKANAGKMIAEFQLAQAQAEDNNEADPVMVEQKKLDFEMWKVELQEATKVTVAAIAAKTTMGTALMNAEQAAMHKVAEVQSASDQNGQLQQIHSATLDAINGLAQQIAKPHDPNILPQ